MSRASVRKVLLVAATRSGSPAARSFFAAGAEQVVGVRLELVQRGEVGTTAVAGLGEEPAGHPAGAQRQRQGDVGVLVDAAGQLQRAAADVEHQQPAGAPAEPAADGEEGQPGLVLAGEHLQVDAGAARGPGRAPRGRCRRPGWRR